MSITRSPPGQRSSSHSDIQNITDTNLFVSMRKRKERSDSEGMELRDEILIMLSNMKKDQDAKYNKLKESMDEIKQQNKDVIKAQRYIEEKLESINTSYELLNEKICNVKKEQDSMQLKIHRLEESLEDALRIQNAASVEIRNITEVDRSQLSNIIERVHSSTGTSLDKNSVRRVTVSKTGKDKHTIIVQYQTEEARMQILTAVKNYNKNNITNKISTKTLGLKGEERPVYISEVLTATAKTLHYHARNLQKSHGFKFCWTAHGKIFLRKTDGSPAIQVKSLNQIESLKMETSTSSI